VILRWKGQCHWKRKFKKNSHIRLSKVYKFISDPHRPHRNDLQPMYTFHQIHLTSKSAYFFNIFLFFKNCFLFTYSSNVVPFFHLVWLIITIHLSCCTNDKKLWVITETSARGCQNVDRGLLKIHFALAANHMLSHQHLCHFVNGGL